VSSPSRSARHAPPGGRPRLDGTGSFGADVWPAGSGRLVLLACDGDEVSFAAPAVDAGPLDVLLIAGVWRRVRYEATTNSWFPDLDATWARIRRTTRSWSPPKIKRLCHVTY